jgi:hypothetical protein
VHGGEITTSRRHAKTFLRPDLISGTDQKRRINATAIHFLLADGKQLTSAFSALKAAPLSTVTEEFLNAIPFALRITRPVAAEICTFSKTTFVMQLSGKPKITPADLWQMAVRLLTRMLR